MVTLEAKEKCIIRGYAQYNKGDRASFTEEEALKLLEEYPDGWQECRREDAEIKAQSAPPKSKMVKQPERKK